MFPPNAVNDGTYIILQEQVDNIACYKPALIDLETLMNVKDANIIYRMIRDKYPPSELPPEVLTVMIDVLLSYFARKESEGDKAEAKAP